MPTIHRGRRALGSGIALGLAAAALSLVPGVGPVPAAQAATGGGSIVYVKDHNVWITDGDGGAQRQVTAGGTAADPWQSPTQADNGVVVAHHSGLIYRMNQRGEVFNTIDPPDLRDTLGNPVSGRDLTETAISPDGTKIAYTYYKFFDGEKRWATGFTSSSQATDPGQWGIAYYDKPAWVTNNRVVLNAWNRNKAHLYDLGQRDIPWFEEGFYTANRKELTDLEVSRNGQWTVGARGDVGDQTIVVIRNEGDVLTSATPWTPVFGVTKPCEIGIDDKNLREPTISPDGSVVAWAEPGGIYRSSAMTCDPTTRVDILVAAGGSDPSWSAATVGQTPDVPKQQPGPDGPKPTHLDVKKKPQLAGKARVGKVVAVRTGAWSPKPTSFAFRWTRDGKPIKKAVKSRYRLTKQDRGHRIGAVVTAKRDGWLTTVVRTSPLRVKR